RRAGRAAGPEARAPGQPSRRGFDDPGRSFPVGRCRAVPDRSCARVPGGGMTDMTHEERSHPVSEHVERGESPDGDRLREECGVFGIWGAENAARLTYAGLYALQHRGQESAGIVATDGMEYREHKGLGLVSGVFAWRALATLPETRAIVHNTHYNTH